MLADKGMCRVVSDTLSHGSKGREEEGVRGEEGEEEKESEGGGGRGGKGRDRREEEDGCCTVSQL